MTDEEKDVGTERWPSKENIVRFFFLAGCPRLLIKQFQLQAMDNLIRGAAPGDSFVFYCELLCHFCLRLLSLSL